MDKAQLYQDIAKRTQGDIYIGVVGPVRTGKSTFIKRFRNHSFKSAWRIWIFIQLYYSKTN